MNETSFIDTSASLQLGGILDQRLTLTTQSRERALGGSSGSTLAWNTAAGQPFADNGWTMGGGAFADVDGLRNTQKFINREKALGALKTLLEAGARSDLIIDMQDRRLRNTALPDNSLHPVFCFNRRVGDATRILWPLPGYHDLDAPGFLGPADWARVPWQEKRAIVGWRGNLSGRADWHGDVTREGLRLKTLFKQFSRGSFDENKTKNVLAEFPRHRVMLRHFDDPQFDIGYTGADGMRLEDFPFLRRFMRDRITQQGFGAYKYLLVMRGMDVGSSLYWTMNSGSLGLVMEGPFETFASSHFKAWEHYVPFKSDLSDLQQRIEWCRNNDDRCREMAENARRMCQLIARADLRQKISGRVVDRLEKHISACA